MSKLRTYTVVVSFTAECCIRPHLWLQSVSARGRKHAARKVRRQIENQESSRQAAEHVAFRGSLPGIVREFQTRSQR